MHPPTHRPAEPGHPGAGHRAHACPAHRPWRVAGTRLAQAPSHWDVAVPPAAAHGRRRRVALLVAATCGLAAMAHAQATDTGGGGGGGGSTGTAGSGDTAPAGAATPGGTTGAPTGGTTGAPTGATTGPGTTTGATLGFAPGAIQDTTLGSAAVAPVAADAAPGSLRATVEGVLPGVNAAAVRPTTDPAWKITTGISLQEEWTDNALQTASDRKASFITVISPSLSINGSTSRLTADLYYAPTVSYYTPESSQNQLGQNLGSDALLTLAPEELFIRTTGYATVQSINGATGPTANQTLNRATQIQTYDFSIEPYATHRFGGWGSAQVGATASQITATELGGGSTVQNLTSREEFASFTSGENFGRLSSTVVLSAIQNTGSGALQGSTENAATYQGGYAITRSIIALGSFGWEDIRYTGIGAPHFDDATWSVGVQLLPNPDSSIAVTYGHQAGTTAANVNANYAPTPTVRLSVQYSDGITTQAQQLNNALVGATFNALGQPVNAQTGQPINATSNFFGFNSTVFRSKNLSASVAWLRPRDALQFTLAQQTQTPVGNAGTSVLAALSSLSLGEDLAATSGTTGTLSWQHDLSAVVNTNLSFQYGVLHNATPLLLTNGVLTPTLGKQVQSSTLMTVNAQVNWQLTPTLTGLAQYSYTTNDYSNGEPGVSSNLVVLGLRKNF